MIPQEKSAAVCRGLQEAFGTTTFEEIRRLNSLPTADLVYRIVVKGSPVLLRINKRLPDPSRHFANVAAAAKAGVAPPVRYSNLEDQVVITDWVEEAPFPLAEARVHLPALLRRVHALPPFAGVPDAINTSCMFLLNPGPPLDGLLERFHGAKLVDAKESEEVFAAVARVAAIYPRGDGNMVSCHNDLKPENILFDGQRAWIVDWEAAFWNDRYSDLAMFSNFVVHDEADEAVYLREYFGRAADEYERARFYVMRQMFHLFYAMAFLMFGGATEKATPEFREFHDRLWAREVDLSDREMKRLYGRVHWARLLQNLRGARFGEALGLVKDGAGGLKPVAG